MVLLGLLQLAGAVAFGHSLGATTATLEAELSKAEAFLRTPIKAGAADDARPSMATLLQTRAHAQRTSGKAVALDKALWWKGEAEEKKPPPDGNATKPHWAPPEPHGKPGAAAGATEPTAGQATPTQAAPVSEADIAEVTAGGA